MRGAGFCCSTAAEGGGGSSCGRPTATEQASSSYTAARRNGIKFTTAILRGEASPPSVLARLRG